MTLSLHNNQFTVCSKCDSHFLSECNLCKNISHCSQCGCEECHLEKDANTPALSTINEDTRETLLIVSERQIDLKPQKSTKTKAQKVTKDKKINYNELWLDDLLAFNELHYWSTS